MSDPKRLTDEQLRNVRNESPLDLATEALARGRERDSLAATLDDVRHDLAKWKMYEAGQQKRAESAEAQRDAAVKQGAEIENERDTAEAKLAEARDRHTRYLGLIEAAIGFDRPRRETGEPATSDAVCIAELRDDRDAARKALAASESGAATMRAALDDADDCCAHYHDTSYTAWSPQGVQQTRDHIARALSSDAGRAVAEFMADLAAEPCGYRDNCPTFGTRHGRCIHCQARAALALAGKAGGK